MRSGYSESATGRALAQELGIAGHPEADALLRRRFADAFAHQRLHQVAGAHRHGGFVDDHAEARVVHRGANAARGRFQIRQVGLAGRQGRSAHRDEDHIARAHRAAKLGTEFEAAAFRGRKRQHRLQVRFVDRRFAALQARDLHASVSTHVT